MSLLTDSELSAIGRNHARVAAIPRALRGLIDLATIGGAPGSVLDALAPFKPSP